MVSLFWISRVCLVIGFLYAVVGVLARVTRLYLPVRVGRYADRLFPGVWTSLVVIVVVVVLGHVRQTFFQRCTDWSPQFTSQTIEGTWQKGREQLIFSADGTMVYKGQSGRCVEGQVYRWRASPTQARVAHSVDGHGILVGDESVITIETVAGLPVTAFRLILFSGEYRMVDKWGELRLTTLGFSKNS